MSAWTNEIRKAVENIEVKYDIELVSGEHHTERVTKLEEDNSQLRADAESLQNEILKQDNLVEQLRADLAAAVEALRPFAKALERYQTVAENISLRTDKRWEIDDEGMITYADICNVAELLARLDKGGAE